LSPFPTTAAAVTLAATLLVLPSTAPPARAATGSIVRAADSSGYAQVVLSDSPWGVKSQDVV
jgi:hypothetical protein